MKSKYNLKDNEMIYYIKDIHSLTLQDAYKWYANGLSFIFKDGKLRGLTK